MIHPRTQIFSWSQSFSQKSFVCRLYRVTRSRRSELNVRPRPDQTQIYPDRGGLGRQYFVSHHPLPPPDRERFPRASHRRACPTRHDSNQPPSHQVQRVPNDGDCFFSSIKAALPDGAAAGTEAARAGRALTVAEMREWVAEETGEEQLEFYILQAGAHPEDRWWVDPLQAAAWLFFVVGDWRFQFPRLFRVCARSFCSSRVRSSCLKNLCVCMCVCICLSVPARDWGASEHVGPPLSVACTSPRTSPFFPS